MNKTANSGGSIFSRKKTEKRITGKPGFKSEPGMKAVNNRLTFKLSRALEEVESLRRLYDYAPVGYFTIRTDYEICSLNLTGAAMLGKERDSLRKTRLSNFIADDDLVDFEYFFRRLTETGSPQYCEIRFYKDESTTFTLHLNGAKSFEDEKYLITAVDISNNEIPATRFRRLFETARDGIIILDGSDNKILDVNPYLTELLGKESEFFIGRELLEIGFFRNIEEYRRALTELNEKGYMHIDEMPVISGTGSLIFVEIISNIYLVNNARVIQCNIRDITDRRHSIEKIKENEARLYDLNATKDKLFSIIAHDLKSPFTSIIGFSNLLAEKIRKNDFSEIEEYAGMIQSSSWRAMDLLTNLLEWSRSQTGRMEFNPKIIKMAEMVNEVIILLKDSALQKAISVSTEISADITAYADRAMINTILRNLLSNAIKFTESAGKILISCFQTDSHSIIAVSDSGIGIKKEDIDRLFRIDETHTTKGTMGEEGTGLGLFLCNEFARKHDGEILVESKPGAGSKFSLKLPIIHY